MSRIAGIATGTLLASGVLFFMLKPSNEANQASMPSMKALASQWTACDPADVSQNCDVFQAEPEGNAAAEATEDNNPEALSDFTLPKKPIETTPVDTTTEAISSEVVTLEKVTAPNLLADASQDDIKVSMPSLTDEAPVAAEKTTAEAPLLTKITTPEAVEEPLDFDIESTTDLYALDKRYGKKDTNTQENTEPEWQVFWAPFQTEIAAKGFAKRIAKSSGVAVQVIKQDTLKYVVAFPYTNASERKTRARAIEQAFGMKIVGQGDWS